MNPIWDLIDEAPKGRLEPWGRGPRLLLADNEEVYTGRFCRFKDGVRGSWKDDGGVNASPTHWAELPPVPNAASETARKAKVGATQ